LEFSLKTVRFIGCLFIVLEERRSWLCRLV